MALETAMTESSETFVTDGIPTTSFRAYLMALRIVPSGKVCLIPVDFLDLLEGDLREGEVREGEVREDDFREGEVREGEVREGEVL
jgi:hypothetical protein